MSDIEAILKATIQAKVIEAFNSAPEVVDKLVRAALSKEVNENGGAPSGYHDKKMPFMEWLVGEEIRRAVTDSVRQYVKEHKADFDAQVRKAIESADLGTPLSQTISKILSDDFRWHVSLSVGEKES